jgi:hypothetical protein
MVQQPVQVLDLLLQIMGLLELLALMLLWLRLLQMMVRLPADHPFYGFPDRTVYESFSFHLLSGNWHG